MEVCNPFRSWDRGNQEKEKWKRHQQKKPAVLSVFLILILNFWCKTLYSKSETKKYKTLVCFHRLAAWQIHYSPVWQKQSAVWKKQPKRSLQKQFNLTRIEKKNIDVMKTWALAQYHIYSVSGT